MSCCLRGPVLQAQASLEALRRLYNSTQSQLFRAQSLKCVLVPRGGQQHSCSHVEGGSEGRELPGWCRGEPGGTQSDGAVLRNVMSCTMLIN